MQLRQSAENLFPNILAQAPVCRSPGSRIQICGSGSRSEILDAGFLFSISSIQEPEPHKSASICTNVYLPCTDSH